MSADAPRILVIAGPNGAGKTTFAREYLPREAGCLHFLNANLIAAGISPFAPEGAALAAGRIMLAEMARYVAALESFAFETTLSEQNYARLIPTWQAAGYWVGLHFLTLPDADMAIERVRLGVLAGGHSIPEAVIRRRFVAGWQNFERIYQALVDEWAVYDNQGAVSLLLQSGGRDAIDHEQPAASQE